MKRVTGPLIKTEDGAKTRDATVCTVIRQRCCRQKGRKRDLADTQKTEMNKENTSVFHRDATLLNS